MESLLKIYTDYGWGVFALLLFGLGGRMYFLLQPLGLVFILTAVLLLLALENSDMIHAVKEERIDNKTLTTMIVHLHGQRSIAKFIYLYHFYVYGFLVVFGVLILTLGVARTEQFSTLLNILILGAFGIAAITIFIRRILVGAKYEH
jgi:hypothetical protein